VIYFDTTYLVRLYTLDTGWEAVRELACKQPVACSLLGKAELVGAFHRKFRESDIDQKELATLIEQFEADCAEDAVYWYTLSEKVLERMTLVYRRLPPGIALRSSDAIHLATAAENSFTDIYTNDRRMLTAAAVFGVNGVNLI
jgi:predicted nucleic acid-binding protein